MGDDIVTAGRERQPLGTPWLAAGAVALTVLAAVGTWRATGWDLPIRRTAASSPTPTISVPPLETIAPEPPPPLGNLTPGPDAIQAPPYGPGQGFRITLVTEAGLVEVATVDDYIRTLVDPPDDLIITQAVAFDGGYAVGATSDQEGTPTTLTIVTGGHPVSTTLPNSQALVPGYGAEFWTVDYYGEYAQRRDADAHPVGKPVRLPFGQGLSRGLPGGMLLVADVNDSRIRVWDPTRRRYVRTIAPAGGVYWDAGLRHVAWQSACGRPQCTTYLVDVLTGARRVLPTPPGAGGVEAVVVDPTGRSVAYAWSGETGPRDVYVVTPGGKPVRIAKGQPDDLSLDGVLTPVWASADRLVLVQNLQDRFVVYGWEHGRLRLAGTYAETSLGQIVAAH